MSLPLRAPAGDPTPGSPADDAPDADPTEIARAICLQQLTMGPRTRGQLETVLRRRNVDSAVAAAVIGRLEEVLLVNDAQFSEDYVRTRHSGRGLARRAIGYELRGKGISESVVAEALDGLDPGTELATAQALVAKRLASTRRLDVQSRTRRLVGMLARKGYPGGMAAQVVRDALAAERQLDELEAGFLDGLDLARSDAGPSGE